MQKIIVQFNFPEGTLQQYDQIWDELKATGYEKPKGLLFHVAGPKPDGGILVVDVWESAEAFQEFGKALMPIIQKQSGFNAQPKIFPVHNTYENLVESPGPLK